MQLGKFLNLSCGLSVNFPDFGRFADWLLLQEPTVRLLDATSIVSFRRLCVAFSSSVLHSPLATASMPA